MCVFGIITDFQYFCKRFKSMSMSQAIIKKKERRVIIIQGYSKDDQEYNIFSATRMSVARYFASITGGAFDNNEIIQITNTTHTLNKLNDEIDNLTVDIAIFVFMGHGAIQDGKQLFQFSEDEIFYPGQFNYKAPKTLVLVDSCRVPISGCRVESLSKIIPSFIDGGKFRRPITRAEAKSIYNNAFTTIADGMTICFSCSENESAYGFQFLYSLLHKSLKMGVESNKVSFISDLFPEIHKELSNKNKYSQNPIMVYNNTDFPIALPIYK